MTLLVGTHFEQLRGKNGPAGRPLFEYRLGDDNCFEIVVGELGGHTRTIHTYEIKFYNPYETHVVIADQVALAVKRSTH